MGYHLPQVRPNPESPTSLYIDTDPQHQAHPRPAGCADGGCNGGECPYVNLEDARCAAHLTLTDMGYAFDHCFDNFGNCEVHHLISRERADRSAAEERESAHPAREPLVEVAVNGRVRESGWRRWRVRFAGLTIGRRRKVVAKTLQPARRAG